MAPWLHANAFLAVTTCHRLSAGRTLLATAFLAVYYAPPPSGRPKGTAFGRRWWRPPRCGRSRCSAAGARLAATSRHSPLVESTVWAISHGEVRAEWRHAGFTGARGGPGLPRAAPGCPRLPGCRRMSQAASGCPRPRPASADQPRAPALAGQAHTSGLFSTLLGQDHPGLPTAVRAARHRRHEHIGQQRRAHVRVAHCPPVAVKP